MTIRQRRWLLATALTLVAWLVLHLVVLLLVISVLGPLGWALWADSPPPFWFRYLAWTVWAILLVAAAGAGWRWAGRLTAPPEPEPPDAQP
jgi:membrane protein implicated in regulation of membrane protease activity